MLWRLRRTSGQRSWDPVELLAQPTVDQERPPQAVNRLRLQLANQTRSNQALEPLAGRQKARQEAQVGMVSHPLPIDSREPAAVGNARLGQSQITKRNLRLMAKLLGRMNADGRVETAANSDSASGPRVGPVDFKLWSN